MQAAADRSLAPFCRYRRSLPRPSSVAALFTSTEVVYGVTGTEVSEARWPDAAFLLFMLAAVLFVTTVQATFWARGYQTNPPEMKAWWSDADDPARLERLKHEQRRHAAGFRMWSDRARVTYSAALLCLLAALMILAVPPDSHGQSSYLRWLAVAVGAAAFLAEAIWTTGSFTKSKWAAGLLEPPRQDTFDESSVDTES